MAKRLQSFLNDKDGISARDYLLLVSTTVFFLFVIIGLILVLVGHGVPTMYLSLLDMVAPVVMTIVGGVFGVQAVESFRPNRDEEVPLEPEPTHDTYKGESGYDRNYYR